MKKLINIAILLCASLGAQAQVYYLITGDTECPTISVNISGNSIACNGDNTTVTVTPSGGVPPYEYSFDSGAYTSSNTISKTDGSYNVIVRDANECLSSLTNYDVTINDATPPSANCQDITVTLDGTGNETITASQINNSSSDNCGISSTVASITSFNCTDVGNNIVTLTITDTNNNTSTCTSTVTVQDTQVPIALCKDVTVSVSEGGGVTINESHVNNNSSDNCNLQFSFSDDNFQCIDIGDNVVTMTATDDGGNTATCTSTVTIIDSWDPVAVCQDITVEVDRNTSVSVTGVMVNNGSSDNCGLNTGGTLATFDCTDVGTQQVTLTVTDTYGNTDACTASVEVESPELVVSGNSVTITDGDTTPSSTDHTDYGDVSETSSKDRTFTLTNNGGEDLDITNLSLSFSPANLSFQAQSDPTASVISPGGSFDLVLRANYNTSLATGSYTCTVQLTTNECNDNIYTWDITVNIIEVQTALLDSISGADAAYSLRLLTTSYTGDVINVRRSGDNTNQGFTADEITDGTLASWVSAGGGTEDGFVEILYDQIGSANFTMGSSYSYNGDAGINGESGSDSYQPQIVDNGAVLLKDGNPAMLFDGSDDRLCGGYSTNNKTANTFIGVFSVENNSASSNFGLYSHWDNDSPWSTSDDAEHIVYSSAADDIAYAVRATNSSSTTDYYEAARSGSTAMTEFTTQLMIGFLEFSSNTHEMYMNNSTTADGDNGSTLDGVKIHPTTEQVPTIGNHNAGDNIWPWNGYISEIIIFDENKISDRATIQNLINDHYSIW